MSSWALPQRTDRESRYSELRHAADLQTVAYWYLAREAEAVEAGLMPESWRMTPSQAWEYAEMYWRDHVEERQLEERQVEERQVEELQAEERQVEGRQAS